MSFPIHDRLGELDPGLRKKDFAQSVTPEAFLEHTKGKTLDQLGSEAKPRLLEFGPVEYSVPGGPDPNFRFVQDPTDPGGVIDMTHFLEASRFPLGLGEWAGAGVEIEQAIKKFPSAYERQDFKSNFLGVVFRNNYYNPNGNINQQFKEFFNDLKNDNLKGYVPTLEYYLDNGIDKAKDTKRFLQQLGDKIDRYIDRFITFIDPPAYANDAENAFDQAQQTRPTPGCPLILDLDGDGLELTSLNSLLVRFDIDGDGFREATGWVRPDDGLLVLDRNQDGFINDISELFGNQTTGGFAVLRQLDSNNDGAITASDAAFPQLQVWRDLDFDGRSDVNELFSLAELGITRIGAVGTSVNITNADNLINETATFTLTDGTQRQIANVWFALDQLNSYYDFHSTYNQPVTFTQEILNLPNLRGYGNLPDLQIAMAKDPQLLTLVKSLSARILQGNLSNAGELIRPLLLRWAGVDGVSPTSRGTEVDAQELGFLEKFMGRAYLQDRSSNPFSGAGTILSQSYARLIPVLFARFIAQTAQLPVQYDPLSDRLIFKGDLMQALVQLEQAIAQSSVPSQLTEIVLRQYFQEQGGWILGSLASDQLTGTQESDRLYSFSGNDNINSGSGNDTLDGGAGNDTLIGEDGSDTLDGGAGNDTLIGGDGNDHFNGGAGNDTLMGGNGNDLFNGGAGDDVLDDFYDSNWNRQGSGKDTLNGGTGNDTLRGYDEDDTYLFERGGGQDVIEDYVYSISGGNSDTLNLGTGISRTNLRWNFNGKDLSFTLTDSTTDKLTLLNFVDSRYRLENIQVDNTFLTLKEIMTSQVGKDESVQNSLDWVASPIFFDGLAGNDKITTGDYADKLFGGDDNDTLTSNGGHDTLDGGTGNDTLIGGDGNDLLNGGAGDDVLDDSSDSNGNRQGSGKDTLNGGTGNDLLNGGAGDDRVNGGDGNDLIWVGQGHDTVDGGAGSDLLFLNLSNQTTALVVDNPTNGLILARIVTSRNIEQFHLIGGRGNDRLVQAGLVNGAIMRGSDSFDGGAGNDTLNPGLGVGDSVSGADGDDLLILDYSVGDTGTGMTFSAFGSASRLTTTGEILDSLNFRGIDRFRIVGTSKADTIATGNGNDTLDGGAGNDSLHGSVGSDTLDGGDGDDYLRSMYGDDITRTFNDQSVSYSWSGGENTPNLLLGGAGNDTLLGSLGADTLNGGTGHDSLHGHLGNDSLTGGDGQDSLDGSLGNDTLDGGADDDTLDGSWGSDSLLGGAGNDSLNGSSGSDTLDGGDGDDLLWAIVVDPGYGESNNHLLIGGAGHDTLNASFGNDTLDGGSGNDFLNGSFGGDTLDGGDGDDLLWAIVDDLGYGEYENHLLIGGTGNDTLNASLGNDTLDGGSGNDFLNGNFGSDTLDGGDGDDLLWAIVVDPGYGEYDNHLLIGGSGHDTLNASLGNDTLTGGDGNDILNGGYGTDSVTEFANVNLILTNTSLTGNGTDSLSGIETASLTGGSGNNNLNASAFTLGSVTLDGGAGNDTLTGGSRDDILIGGAGNDLLSGGSGNDTLTGGAGLDWFLYDTNATFTTYAIKVDRMADFTISSDRIVLDKTTFTVLKSVSGKGFSVASEFAVVTNDTAVATHSAAIVYSSATGNLFYNQNGAATGLGSGGQFATLTGIPSLTAADFTLQV